jgi:hypothetical protein
VWLSIRRCHLSVIHPPPHHFRYHSVNSMRINDVNLLKQVVRYLDNHAEAARIKKMLYCLCTNRWEKDIDYLNSIDSQNLVEQIVREYNTLDQLKFLLQRLVKTVNKPQQYVEVAKIVYLAIGQLYPEFQQEHRKSKPAAQYQQQDNGVPSAIHRAYAPDPTNSHSAGNSVPQVFQQAYAPEPSYAYSNHANGDYGQPHQSHHHAYEPEATPAGRGYQQTEDYAYETYYDAEIPADIPLQEMAMPEFDPFVLRQNVMSYTNPLRAKIILLVMLHPNFTFNSQSASMLREYNLDDLLAEVMKNYPTVEQLEDAMTYAVEQLVEIEEYGKAATGLLQSLIPLYISRQAA